MSKLSEIKKAIDETINASSANLRISKSGLSGALATAVATGYASAASMGVPPGVPTLVQVLIEVANGIVSFVFPAPKDGAVAPIVARLLAALISGLQAGFAKGVAAHAKTWQDYAPHILLSILTSAVALWLPTTKVKEESATNVVQNSHDEI